MGCDTHDAFTILESDHTYVLKDYYLQWHSESNVRNTLYLCVATTKSRQSDLIIFWLLRL